MKNRYNFLNEKSEYLINLLKNDDHAKNSGYRIIFLVAMFIIFASYHYIKYGFTPVVGMGLCILLILMIFFRIQMQSSVKDNIASANYDAYKDIDQNTYLRNKLQYLFTGIDIKFTRTKTIRLLYVLVFPFLMVIIKEVFQGFYSIGHSFKFLLFAFALGGLFWWFYFASEMDDLEISKDDIKGYLEDI